MKTFARVPVVPGPVHEIYVGDALFPMHPAVATTFHEADSGTLVGYHFDGEVFAPPKAPPVDAQAASMSQLHALEASITPRRIREAVLGIDSGWLHQRNDEITALRAKL